uniref:Tryparedoxin n=1 Tax=Trypanosoma brucei brucei TaxID=5702 RepID=UPI000FE18297|nr:Chain A, Tryparedoxin [Trypanosoma brucei brucei]6GXY_B Chain B, Tryparedoxin [Trypanosoma brucei brucei]6GXY_C Chain C, Tryparedoxin [Trypanosoma brucei brucei]
GMGSGLAKYLPGATNLLSKSGEVSLGSLVGKTVFLYFSASWCPPCRGFTPVLAEFYEKHHVAKNFEVVLISWDENESDFHDYYGKMPWLALPFDQRSTVSELGKTFGVESIPTLITINADTGAIIGTQARTRVIEDPDGANFPWPN